jgi:putative transcriptional regulator
MKDTVTNKVQEYRKTNQLTQIELADIVGVTRQTIISIEKGNYIPSVALALKIAEAYSAQVEDIFLLTN